MPNKITYKNDEWILEDPTPYHLLLTSDFVESDETPKRLKTEVFTGFYLIFTCLINDTGGLLMDEVPFETFMRNLDFSELERLKNHLEKFRDFMSDFEETKDDQDDIKSDKD